MESIKNIIEHSIELKQRMLLDEVLLKRIGEAADKMVSCFRSSGRVFLCGNGGSAADAQHIAAELSGRFYLDRQPLPAEALHVNTSFLTAVANDYGFEEVYARLVKGLAKEGDILIGLSTSGNSPNIIKAFEAARESGVFTIALTGSTGGKIKQMADILINVPDNDTPRIQEAHILIGHIICQLVESIMFSGHQNEGSK